MNCLKVEKARVYRKGVFPIKVLSLTATKEDRALNVSKAQHDGRLQR